MFGLTPFAIGYIAYFSAVGILLIGVGLLFAYACWKDNQQENSESNE